MSTIQRFISGSLILLLLLTLITTSVVAQQGQPLNSTNEEGIQNSVGVKEVNIKDANAAVTFQALSYSRYWYIPACTFYSGNAFASIVVSYGGFSVDYYSSKMTYHGTGFCSSDSCGYLTWAPAFGYISENEYIYFVTVTGNNPVIASAWCGRMASPER